MLKSPISLIVASGNYEKLQDYLKDKTSAECLVDKDNLLHIACIYNHLNIAKELLKYGANISYRDSSDERLPLHHACKTGNKELVELIAKLSLNYIDSSDKNGFASIHICAMEGELDSLKILISNGANFSLKDKNGMNLIHWAAKRNHPSIIEYLINLEIDINEKCFNGKTALHYAAMFNSMATMQLLVRCQADITLGDNDNCSSLHMAAKHGSIECLRYLVSEGIPVNIKDINGITPAHLASSQGFYECLHWLLDNNADITAVDNGGNTVGHHACRRGQAKTIHCFLSHNGSTELKNNEGETMYGTARRYGHPVKFEMSKKSEICCDICQLEMNKNQWDQIHALPSVIKSVNSAQKTLFKNPLGSYLQVIKENKKSYGERKIEIVRRNLETINIGKASTQKLQKNPSEPQKTGYRDLITRFYGEYVHNK